MKSMKMMLFFIFVLGISASLFAQIPVQLPTLEVTRGDTIAVPLTLGDLQNNAIYSCYTIINFDEQVLTPVNATNAETISENWAAPVVNLDSLGVFKLGLYGADSLTTAGTLVFLNFIASGDFGDTTSLVFDTFEFNANHADDPQPALQNGFVSIKPKPINITVTTSVGEGTTVIVDGNTYPAPFTTSWEPGTEHTLGIDSPQAVGDDTLHYFESWNDGMAQTHLVTPETDTVFTASLRTQYRVQIISRHGTPSGAGWYDAGSQVTVSIDTLVAGNTNTRYRFAGWTGTGPGAYSGPDNPASFTITGPVVELANWTPQFKLEVNTLPAGLAEISGTGWYNAGTEATTGTAPDSVGEGAEKKDFFYWMVDGKKVSGNPISVTMDTAHVASAAYLGYISVDVGTNLTENSVVIIDGDTLTAPVTQTWIDGSEHTLDVPETQLEENGQRFVFGAWSDGGTRQHVVAPTTDTTFTATLLKEFQLRVVTKPANIGDLTTTTWHALGTSVNLGPAPDSLSYADDFYGFAYWEVDDSQIFENTTNVTLDTPKVAIAHYLQNAFIQGKITVMDAPVSGVRIYLNETRDDSVTSDARGEFLFENLVADEYTLVPEFTGLKFDESQLTIDLNTGNVKNLVVTAIDTLAPEVELLNPLGGESFVQGDPVEIKWKAFDNVGIDSLELYFSADAGSNWTILATTDAQDSVFAWTVPEIISATCFIQVQANDLSGNWVTIQNQAPFIIQDATAVKQLAEKSFSFQLHQNYPNPFNPMTEITFEMPRDGMATLKIFNINGQEIATLFRGWTKAGPHRIQWKANDLPSGIYFYQFRGLGKVMTRRMLLTK